MAFVYDVTVRDEGQGKWPWPNLKHCYCSLGLFVNLWLGTLIVNTIIM